MWLFIVYYLFFVFFVTVTVHCIFFVSSCDSLMMVVGATETCRWTVLHIWCTFVDLLHMCKIFYCADMEYMKFCRMSLRAIVQWHFVSFNAVRTCHIFIRGTNTRFSHLTRAIWLSKSNGQLHAHKTDRERHFERFSRDMRHVIQIQHLVIKWREMSHQIW